MPKTNPNYLRIVICITFLQENVLKRLKNKILRDFITATMKPIVGFGNNCFKVQIGMGTESEEVIGMFHIVLLGGDGKELDNLCGCNPAKYRMCRLCLECRPSLFTQPEKAPQSRSDSIHEQLSYDLLQLDNKAGKKKRFMPTDSDKALIERGKSFCIVAGDNPVYELFYSLNILGIAGMHSSASPDLLHVVLKGIVEKTLGNTLILILGIQNLFNESHFNAMAILDQRVGEMEPVEFDWMRWASFSNGLSQLLKVEVNTGYSTGK